MRIRAVLFGTDTLLLERESVWVMTCIFRGLNVVRMMVGWGSSREMVWIFPEILMRRTRIPRRDAWRELRAPRKPTCGCHVEILRFWNLEGFSGLILTECFRD